ncbi:MAG: hypothetical protein MJ137_00005, partial [Clostridia bacterium]|nr:hypothetical protein [Clostridia bacterium]
MKKSGLPAYLDGQSGFFPGLTKSSEGLSVELTSSVNLIIHGNTVIVTVQSTVNFQSNFYSKRVVEFSMK